MASVYYDKLFALINIVYRKIFHEEVSFEVEKFIKNLSYVGIGTVIASVFSFTYNVLAGRWLGPSEYGTFTLVQSVAMFLYIPMLLGFHTAMIKYNAEKDDILRQRCIISTTYILVLLFTVVSLLAYFICNRSGHPSLIPCSYPSYHNPPFLKIEPIKSTIWLINSSLFSGSMRASGAPCHFIWFLPEIYPVC